MEIIDAAKDSVTLQLPLHLLMANHFLMKYLYEERERKT